MCIFFLRFWLPKKKFLFHLLHFSTVVMCSNKYGKKIAEGDEENVAYDDEGLFEIDDLPSSFYNPPPSPETKVHYYVPTNEPPCGLSQSLVICRSNYLYSQLMESSALHNHTYSNIYSQSAPPSYYLYDYPNISTCSMKKDMTLKKHTEKTGFSQTQLTLSGTPDGSTLEPTVSHPLSTTSRLNTKPDCAFIRIHPSTTTEPNISTASCHRSWVIDYRIPLGVSKNSFSDFNMLSKQRYENNEIYPSHPTCDEIDQYWENLHCGNQNVNRLKSNTFINEEILRHKSVMKVTGLNINLVKYKNFSRHFYDCNVVVLYQTTTKNIKDTKKLTR